MTTVTDGDDCGPEFGADNAFDALRLALDDDHDDPRRRAVLLADVAVNGQSAMEHRSALAPDLQDVPMRGRRRGVADTVPLRHVLGPALGRAVHMRREHQSFEALSRRFRLSQSAGTL